MLKQFKNIKKLIFKKIKFPNGLKPLSQLIQLFGILIRISLSTLLHKSLGLFLRYQHYFYRKALLK